MVVATEFENIARFAKSFQQRKVCDVSEIRQQLPEWTCEIDDPDDPEESDWSLSNTVLVGDTEYLVTFWHDNPKRLYVNVSPGPDQKYTYIGKIWSWSIYAEPIACYVSDCSGYDALPESTKTWLNEINHVFEGIGEQE